jgi:hypothetical chaperone protein
MDDRYVGIDFGTTNSTLATANEAGEVVLTHYDVRGKTYDTFRSVLFFDPETRKATGGIEGIFAYLDAGSAGRFLQSVKSYLASKTFRSTNIYNKVYTLEQLIALIVSQLKAKAKDTMPSRVVVGRPVRFVNDDNDEEGDAVAEGRLRTAILAAGFSEVHFEFEPVAAAYQYESTLDKDELVLIADFGGGTTDLCLIDVGPNARSRGRGRVRATDGVALAGDTFDQRIIQHAIAPQLGAGTKYRVFGGDADVPLWLYSSLARWHLLSFLKSPRTMQTLDTIVANAFEREALSSLRRIVEDDMGYSLHEAVEKAKITLSHEDEAHIDFDAGTVRCTISRADFDTWIAPDISQMEAAVSRTLQAANVEASAVDRVFMTGGTSLVPAVRRSFETRFGKEKLRGGEEMTSVGRGLALVARDQFARAPRSVREGGVPRRSG